MAAPSEEQDRLAQLTAIFQKYKRVILIGAVLGVICAGALAFALTRGAPPTPPPAGTDVPSVGDQVYNILPETTRPLETGEAKQPGQSRDPFANPMVLTGVILGDGGNLALIEAGEAAHIVTQEDVIADTWTVKKIGPDFVLLAGEEQELRLDLSGR